MERAYSTLEIKSFDEATGEFEGIASTPTSDRMGDIVEPMGAQFKLPLSLLYQHRSSQPIGLITSAKPNKDGIPVKGRVMKELLNIPWIQEAWTLIQAKLIRGLSIGFVPIESEPLNPKEPWGAQRFMAWDWLELSVVTIPANAEASINTIKSIDTAQRAALGADGRGDRSAAPTPGASGTKPNSPKGNGMKTYAQQLKELQDNRVVKQTRVKELAEGCGGDVATLEEAEVTEYDALIEDVRGIDTQIKRVKGTMQAIEGATEVSLDAGTDQDAARRARGGSGVELKKPQLEKGIALAQYVKFLGRAKGNPMHALAMAQSLNNVDPRVPRMLKTAVEAGTTVSGNWAANLVGSETSAFADFIEWLRPQTIIGKFGTGGIPSLHRVPFRVPLIGQTSGGSGYWVGQGKGKPLTKFSFSRTHLDPLKAASMCVLSMELIRDSSPGADPLIRNQLGAAVRERLDTDFIDPTKTAVSGVSPASITNGISATHASGATAAAVRVDVKAAFQSFIDANNAPTSGVWIMSSTTALALSLMINTLGQPEFPGITMNGGTFVGLPVITSEYVPTDSSGSLLILVNADDVYFGDDGDVSVDVSEHASVEMSDAPANNTGTPTASAYMVSMFQTNSVAFRAERTIDWLLRRASAVSIIDEVQYT